MKATRRNAEHTGPARIALLLGISIGLGIVVHEGFFIVAGAIAVGALTVATMHAIREHSDGAQLTHYHR